MDHSWWIEQKFGFKKKRWTLRQVLQKSFFQVLKDFAKNSSMSSVQQIVKSKTNWKLRILWTIILAMLFALMIYILVETWVHIMTNPLILMPQYSTFSISTIDFPAIALCNANRISKKALEIKAASLLKSNYMGNISEDELKLYLHDAGRLLDFSLVEDYRPAFKEIERLVKERTDYDILKVKEFMKMLAPSCDEMLLSCTWAGKRRNCSELFSTRRTARGHCCTFNYILDFDENGLPNKKITALRQEMPGYLHGLNVIIDPLINDYAYPLNFIKGFDVLVYEPTHFADFSAGRVLHRLAEPNKLEFLELSPIRQTCSHEVRKYPLSVRKCSFKEENPVYFNDLYSFSACIVRCKLKNLVSLCACAPYYMPMGRLEGRPCLVSDLRCLNKHKGNTSFIHPPNTQSDDPESKALHCPDCYPDCEHTRYISKSYKTSFDTHSKSIDKYFVYGFGNDINLTEKCVLSIYFAKSKGELERLDVMSYWYQIISNIGGYTSVLFGLSVISIVEIIYFCILRYPQIAYKNYKDFH